MAAAKASAKEIERLARETLGIEQLRPGQLQAIKAVTTGRDTLAVMSTGYGKSAIYQPAGELLDGPTIVVSPLIALQRDQVEAIEEAAPGEAAELNSTISERKREELMEALRAGEREFVLLAPEQLAKEEVLEELRETEPSLLVVDGKERALVEAVQEAEKPGIVYIATRRARSARSTSAHAWR